MFAVDIINWAEDAWVAERVDARDLKSEKGDLAVVMPSRLFLFLSTT
jgi:hypothetical protein